MSRKRQISPSETTISENYKNLSADELDYLLIEKICDDMQWGGEV